MGLIDILPTGVDFLLANDIWLKIHYFPDQDIFNAITTRSMTKEATQQIEPSQTKESEEQTNPIRL